MLVLSRRECEQICFGNDIELTIVAISGNQVRVGIKAPREVRVLRTELQPNVEPTSGSDPVAA